MATRKTASATTAEAFAKERERIKRALAEPKPTRTGQVKTSPAPPSGVVRVTLEGERPGPIQSEPIRVPEPADRIELRVLEAADAGKVQLVRAGTEHVLSTTLARPDGRASYQRPPARQPYRKRTIHPGEEGYDPMHSWVDEPTNEKPAPRFPEAIALVAYPTPMRKPPSSPWRAVVEVRFIK
jgi:hypothetical protein